MDSRLINLEEDIVIYNKVKDLVMRTVCKEGYMTEEEVKEILADAELEGNSIKVEEFAKMIMNRM